MESVQILKTELHAPVVVASPVRPSGIDNLPIVVHDPRMLERESRWCHCVALDISEFVRVLLRRIEGVAKTHLHFAFEFFPLLRERIGILVGFTVLSQVILDYLRYELALCEIQRGDLVLLLLRDTIH